MDEDLKLLGKIGVPVALMLGGLLTLFMSMYTVDSGERAIVLRNGAISHISEPGMGFKLPLIDSVRRISIQSQMLKLDTEALYSKDQQTAVAIVSIGYSVLGTEVANLYTQYGSIDNLENKLIIPQLRKKLKEVSGRFTSTQAIQEREKLGLQIQEELQNLSGLIKIDNIQIENIDFSDEYETAIENRMKAEVEVQQAKQKAEKEKVEAEITVMKAKAEADSKLAISTAEAEGLRKKGEVLKNSPELIYLMSTEKWNGELPKTMLPGSSVPFLNLTQDKESK